MLLNCTAQLTYQDKSGAETSSALSCGLPALEFWLMVLGQPVHCKCQFKRSKYRISGLLLAAGERRARLGCTNQGNKGQSWMISSADLPLESQNWKCNAKKFDRALRKLAPAPLQFKTYDQRRASATKFEVEVDC